MKVVPSIVLILIAGYIGLINGDCVTASGSCWSLGRLNNCCRRCKCEHSPSLNRNACVPKDIAVACTEKKEWQKVVRAFEKQGNDLSKLGQSISFKNIQGDN